MANRLPAPGWHLPQVAARFLACTVEFGIRRWKDVVHAVATGAIGHGLRPGLRRQAVERRVEADQTVAGKTELARQAHVAVAVSAGVADILAVHRRGCIAGLEDGVLAVAIRAHRRLQYAARHRFAVYAGLERVATSLWHMPQVSGTAGPERRRPGDLDFVRRTVTRAALGRGRISLASFLPVDAAGVLGRYLLMAACADWLRDSVRVRVVLVLYMAGLAG